MYKIFGIPNCDSVKKARFYFDNAGIEYEFINFKKSPAEEDLIRKWLDQIEWDTLMNKKGTSYRKLSPEQKEFIVDADTSIPYLLQNNSLIKRPIIELNDKIITVGFDENQYNELFK